MDGVWDTITEGWDSLFGGDEIPVDIPDANAQAPATAEEKSFWDTVAQFKRKADEFWTVYKRLEALEPIAMQTAETRADYNRVMDAGQTLTENIEGTADSIQEAVSWGAMAGIQPRRLAGLGIWPIAIIAAAIAAISIWLSDAYVEVHKLESVKSMIKEGVPATTAVEAAKTGTVSAGGFGTAMGTELGKAAGFAAIIGVGVWLLMRKG